MDLHDFPNNYFKCLLTVKHVAQSNILFEEIIFVAAHSLPTTQNTNVRYGVIEKPIEPSQTLDKKKCVELPVWGHLFPAKVSVAMPSSCDAREHPPHPHYPVQRSSPKTLQPPAAWGKFRQHISFPGEIGRWFSGYVMISYESVHIALNVPVRLSESLALSIHVWYVYLL